MAKLQLILTDDRDILMVDGGGGALDNVTVESIAREDAHPRTVRIVLRLHPPDEVDLLRQLRKAEHGRKMNDLRGQVWVQDQFAQSQFDYKKNVDGKHLFQTEGGKEVRDGTCSDQ
jgi:hypothetical protein